MNIFVLHRGDEQVCARRIADLSQFGDVITCSDKEDIKPGFRNLCSNKSFPDITAWDMAFSKLADDPKDSWFFENDVRWGSSALPKIFQLSSKEEELITCKYKTVEEQPDWFWWDVYAHHFKIPKRSFNPVCRLRKSLIEKILEFRIQNQGFVFHELLFASLASSCFDLQKTNLVGPAFRWRPEITAEEMKEESQLFHPVKD